MLLVIIKLLQYTYSIGNAVIPYTVNIDPYVSRICVVLKFKSLHVKLQNCDKIIIKSLKIIIQLKLLYNIMQVIIIVCDLHVTN
jgi:hypothetical protein